MVKVNLVNRTVENTGDSEVLLKEFIEKKTLIAPGDTVILDHNTKIIEV